MKRRHQVQDLDSRASLFITAEVCPGVDLGTPVAWWTATEDPLMDSEVLYMHQTVLEMLCSNLIIYCIDKMIYIIYTLLLSGEKVIIQMFL